MPKLPTRPPRSDTTVAAILWFFGCALGGVIVGLGIQATVDDGFYYLEIARNLALGHGSTFDGVNATNGYHPLWLWMLVPIFWVTADLDFALLLDQGLQACLFGCTTTLVFLVARTFLGRGAAAASAVSWTAFSYTVSSCGLEFGVQATFILLATLIIVRSFVPTRPVRYAPYVWLGLVCTCSFLARLDAIMFGAVVGFWLLARECRTGIPRAGANRLALFAAAVLVPFGVYVASNLVFFDTTMTVSGAFKRAWSARLVEMDPLYRDHGWLVAKLWNLTFPLRYPQGHQSIALVLGLCGPVALWTASLVGPTAWRQALTSRLSPWLPLVLYGWCGYLAFGLLYHTHFSYSYWYYAAQPMAAALTVGTIVDLACRRWSPGAQRLLIGATILLAAAWCGWGIVKWRQRQEGSLRQVVFQNGAKWANENLDADAVVGSWNAGAIGYYARCRVVNLDGLVNSASYLRDGHRDLCKYWTDQGITHLIDIFDDDDHVVHFLPLHGAYDQCKWRLEEIHTDRRYRDFWHLAVYRVRAPRNSPWKSRHR